MLIESRGIFEDRFDAPFIGTMIAAKSCKLTCPNCFHRDRLSDPIYTYDSDELLSRIKSNPFTQGIILGYFEWLDYQEEECYHLIESAYKLNLEVILYTRRYIEELVSNYSRLFKYPGLYIKFGPYDMTKLSHNYTAYGVPLASTNQGIIRI